MAIDPYAACPCGSGKKFKWCCQPIHAEIDRAFEQHNAGQHEAALQAMKAVVDAHTANPEAWGRYAQLLAINGKPDAAEHALDKAFEANPGYAFGYLLRGQFRVQEGELVGGLVLFRKAADLYSPDAADPLTYLCELIADLELRLNRPVAARAALKQAVHLQPATAELRQTFEQLFGDKSRLPFCARKEYALRAPSPAPDDWAERLRKATTGRLSDAAGAFQSWVEAHPDDPAGWFDLGLTRAWVGDNAAAVEALTRCVELENDEAKAADAWALVEVLRCGDGLVADADYTEHRAVLSIRDATPVMALLEVWEKANRLVGLRANPDQGMLTGLVLEARGGLVESAEGPAFGRLGAYLLVAGSLVQLWNPSSEALDQVVSEVRQKFGPTAPPVQNVRGPIMFTDVVAEAMIYPTRPTTELDVGVKIREQAAAYFEEKWIHRPLKSLGGVPPVDAAGHAVLRRRLLGCVTFLQDCAEPTSIKLYDFDRLRRKLGLTVSAGGMTPFDFGVMSAAELAAVDPEPLSAEQLGEAFRAAVHLDARDLAGRFARSLVGRKADGPADRWAFFSHLITQAQQEGRFDDALIYVDDGEKADCEHNEGRRRNDFELRRGQVLAKSGDARAAADVFGRLVDRAPDEIRYAVTAAETMLGAKNGAEALKFAENGLNKARAQNNRDAEENLAELAAAARRIT